LHGWLALRGEITVGALVAFLGYLGSVLHFRRGHRHPLGDAALAARRGLLAETTPAEASSRVAPG